MDTNCSSTIEFKAIKPLINYQKKEQLSETSHVTKQRLQITRNMQV